MPTSALLQLVAKGRQDAYLTGEPQFTFFKHVYRRHQRFAIESIPIEWDGTPNWGQRLSCLIPRKAELLSQMFLEIDLPPLPQQNFGNGLQPVYWVNDIGHVLIEDISIEIGEKEIDKHVGQWLHIWDELTVPPGIKSGYNTMIGHFDTYPPPDISGGLSLSIPLRFWFCRSIGAALPLIALQAHPIRIIMHLAPFQNLWWSRNVLATPPPSGQPCPTIPSVPPSRIQLFGDYIYLDTDERRMFAAREHEYLITQLQISPVQTVPIGQQNVVVPLYFNNCCTEMAWVIQRTSAQAAHDWYNFSSGTQTDLLSSAILRLDGYDRFQARNAAYFRLTQPYQRHTNIPTGPDGKSKFIYLYSFALKPEDEQPSGTLNCSKIDNITWTLTMDPGQLTMERQVYFYAVNYNILRIVGGLGGVAFIA
jgi:hypothetical protein